MAAAPAPDAKYAAQESELQRLRQAQASLHEATGEAAAARAASADARLTLQTLTADHEYEAAARRKHQVVKLHIAVRDPALV